MGVHVVWLKRDLRVRDHGPLLEASLRGPVCVLYVYEPPLWQRPEHDASHLVAVNQALAELEARLRERGGRITFRVGRAVPTLEALRRTLEAHGGIDGLWSHQETGLGWTFSRDRAVADWAREHGIPWTEIPQDGVCRPHPRRDGWAGRWTKQMARTPYAVPDAIQDVSRSVADWRHEGPRTAAELGLGPTTAEHTQPVGESHALETLDSFLGGRVQGYRRSLSSPLTAWDGCSRLSVHLAWGTVSTRTAWQSTRLTLRRHQGRRDAESRAQVEDLEAFEGRLRWRGHFMQKLEDAPRIEHDNVHRAVDGVREPAFDRRKFAAWCAGRTGWPMVDACMRSVQATKWLNFRMRALLMSTASYPLWLHWREPAVFLARHFLDFEPGIHFSQAQMQAGTSGINRLRIYDPHKQGRDHDPDGRFIRRWVPELRGVPDAFIHAPHRMDATTQQRAGCRIGHDYPAPLVDARRASALARRKLERARASDEARAESRAIHHRHGSRLPARRRRWR